MNPIDPRDIAQRAEEARRRAEALARSRQQGSPGQRVQPGAPPGSSAHGRTPLLDVVEKTTPSLFGSGAVQGQRPGLEPRLDRQQTAAVFAASAPPLPAGVRAASPAVASRPPVVVDAAAAWARASSTVLGASVASLADKARWLEARASQAKDALDATDEAASALWRALDGIERERGVRRLQESAAD